jgi:hypothetical protein
MPKRYQKTFQPEYIRLPASGEVEPYSGLNRSALERLILPGKVNNYDPPVQSKLFNPSGGKRLVRLIIFRSLMAHLAKLPTGFEKSPAIAPKVTTPRSRRKAKEEVAA